MTTTNIRKPAQSMNNMALQNGNRPKLIKIAESSHNSDSFPPYARFVRQNTPNIQQAIRMMRQRSQARRGPKEKETFQRYVYCLPGSSAKIPKFTSHVLTEKALVQSHQDAGYGMFSFHFHYVRLFS